MPQGPLAALQFALNPSLVSKPLNSDASGNLLVNVNANASASTGFPYQLVAASQTNAGLGVAGAIGDYLQGFLIVPAIAACGVVTIKDNTTAIISFPGGGTTALPNLEPIWVPVGAQSQLGGWTVTTGASVSVVAVGKFA
jgi:apolipoprotein N-acyltransferase